MRYRAVFSMNRKTILESIVAFLVFIFLYTGLSKYLNINQFRGSLGKSPMLSDYKDIVSIVLPGVEVLTTALLIVPKFRLIGLHVTLVLLSMFTVYLVYMVSFDPKLPCTCGGIISQLNWHQHIVLNLFLLTISFLGIKIQREINSKSGVAVGG